MNKLIACCGLDCEKCDAYLATKNNDDALRRKTAEEWSRLNSVTILPEHINCEGCRTEGVKTYYCSELCPIRKCAREKQFSTCGSCPELDSCPKAAMVIGNNAEARRNLKGE